MFEWSRRERSGTLSGQIETVVDMLLEKAGRIPESICSRFGLTGDDRQAFEQVYDSKGRCGRGRMQNAVERALSAYPNPNRAPSRSRVFQGKPQYTFA